MLIWLWLSALVIVIDQITKRVVDFDHDNSINRSS